MADFPRKLRELRERRRLSMRVVADFCELSKSTISRYERGEQIPTLEAVQKLAEFFGVSMDYFLGTKK